MRAFCVEGVRERSLGFGFVAYSLLSEPSEKRARGKRGASRERTDGDQDQFSVPRGSFLWRGEEDRQRDEDAYLLER